MFGSGREEERRIQASKDVTVVAGGGIQGHVVQAGAAGRWWCKRREGWRHKARRCWDPPSTQGLSSHCLPRQGHHVPLSPTPLRGRKRERRETEQRKKKEEEET